MRRDELVHEIAARMAVPDQTASVLLHAIFTQMISALVRDGNVSIPKLGTFRFVRHESGEHETRLKVTDQFARTLAVIRNQSLQIQSEPPAAATPLVPEHETHLASSLVDTEEKQERTPIDLPSLYRGIMNELAVDLSTWRSPSIQLDADAHSNESGAQEESIEPEAKQNEAALDHLDDELHRDSLLLERMAAPNRIHELEPEEVTAIEEAEIPAPVEEVVLTPPNEAMPVDRAAATTVAVDFDREFDTREIVPDEQLTKQPKRSLWLTMIGYVLTIALIGAGLYFVYTQGYIDHLLPEKYKRRPTNADTTKHATIVTTPSPASRRQTSTPRTPYYLQVRIAHQVYDADARLKQAQLQGFRGRVMKSEKLLGGKRWFEVVLGPYHSLDTARRDAEQFRTSFGYPATIDSTHN